MKTVKLVYSMNFGKCDSCGGEWDLELTDEEAVIYENSIANKLPLNDVIELQDALSRGEEEITEQEMENAREIAEDDDEEFDEEEFLSIPLTVSFADPNE